MRKSIILLISVIAVIALMGSCNDYETYGDMKEKERNAISKFIADSSFTIISEDQFNQQGQTTRLERREFVKLDKSGVYMQIVRKGCGTPVQDGETATLVCRCSEFNLLTDTLTLLTNTSYTAATPDIMRVSRTSGTFTAQFTKSVAYNMCSIYGSTVPAGWLVPLTYVNVGMPEKEGDEIAKVRLIVPHTQGHSTASSNVVPYFYEITFQREA